MSKSLLLRLWFYSLDFEMSSFTYNILRANDNSFKETTTFNIAILPAEFIYVYVYYYNSNKNTLNIHLEVKLASLRDSTIR